jgi:hypothetical protein
MKNENSIPEKPCNKHIVNGCGLLLDYWERQIILDFYKRCETKSKWWKWWHSNIIVDRYEQLKAKRNFDRDFSEMINNSFIGKFSNWLDSHCR